MALGLTSTVVLVFVGGSVLAFWRAGECHGEEMPLLGSVPQAYVRPGCLAENEGWLFRIKQRLRIYDPNWKIVIKQSPLIDRAAARPGTMSTY